MTRKASKPEKNNLFKEFRAISTAEGQPFADALRWLNGLTGLNTANSRYGQYERGEVKPKTASINLILARVLESKLKALGLEPSQIDDVITSSQLPENIEEKPASKRRVARGNPKKRA